MRNDTSPPPKAVNVAATQNLSSIYELVADESAILDNLDQHTFQYHSQHRDQHKIPLLQRLRLRHLCFLPALKGSIRTFGTFHLVMYLRYRCNA